MTNEREDAGNTPGIPRAGKLSPQPIPPILYKYQEFAPHTLENLVKRQIWFSKPESFNDPFDFAVPIVDSPATDDDWERLYQLFRATKADPESVDAAFSPTGSRTTEFRKVAMLAWETEASEWHARIRTERGVSSFSSTNSDLLMWGHYADKHRGICLGFRTDTPLFAKPHAVTYTADVVRMNPIEPIFRMQASVHELVKKTLLFKSECWAYEQEWRLIHVEGDRAYGYGAGDLVAVYFGLEMPMAWRIVIGRLLNGTETKFYEMRRHPTKFALVPAQVGFRPPV